MGLSCSKKEAYAAGKLPVASSSPAEPAPPTYADLPRIHADAILGSWCLDGDRVVTCGADGVVAVSDVGARTAVGIGKHAASANRAVAAGDGVFVCSRDLTVKRWDGRAAAAPREAPLVFEGHELNVTAVAVDEGGATLASGSRDYTVRTWDGETGAETACCRVPRNVVTCAGWIPGTRTFAQGSEDLRLRVWDARDLRAAAAEVRGGYTFFPLALAARDTVVATSSKGFNGEGGEIRVWDLRKPDAQIANLRGHTQDATGVAFISETRVLSASKDGTLKLWDLNENALVRDVRVGASGPVMYTGLSTGTGDLAAVATTFQGGVLCLDADLDVVARVDPD